MRVIAVFVVLSALEYAATAQQVRASSDAALTCTAFAASTGGPRTARVATSVDIVVDRWSSEAERRQLLDALKRGQDATVTVGVISATGRPFPVSEGRWQDVLQTDAAINPGNSGGPLLNLRGEVVGMSTAIVSGGPLVGNVGVGFAIPIDVVRELLPELRKGTITRGRIGVQISPVTKELAEPLGLEDARGALVRLVEKDGPAAAAGVEPGDVTVRYNDKPVDESDDLVEMVTRTDPGTTVPIEIGREGDRKTLRVTVAELEFEDGDVRTGEPADTGFGMSLRDLTPQIRRRLDLPSTRDGAVVTGVEQASAASRAGIRAGDVILEVNRKPVSRASDAAAALRGVEKGDTAFVLLWRNGQELFVTATPE